jgi:hypothetical protein
MKRILNDLEVRQPRRWFLRPLRRISTVHPERWWSFFGEGMLSSWLTTDVLELLDCFISKDELLLAHMDHLCACLCCMRCRGKICCQTQVCWGCDRPPVLPTRCAFTRHVCCLQKNHISDTSGMKLTMRFDAWGSKLGCMWIITQDPYRLFFTRLCTLIQRQLSDDLFHCTIPGVHLVAEACFETNDLEVLHEIQLWLLDAGFVFAY